MISKYDLIQYAKKSDQCWFRIEEDKNVIDKETGEFICGIDILLQHMREKMHCDFECVYDCHGLLEVVLRCKQCGTVIFTTEDEDYDPNLCCPTCGEYKTQFEYWTAEDIKADPKKQGTIKHLEQMQQEHIEAEKRRKRRKGKYDWQIGGFRIHSKKHGLIFNLECDNLFRTKLKGLRLKIVWANRDGHGFIYKKRLTIPLSYSYFKLMQRIRKKNNSSK